MTTAYFDATLDFAPVAAQNTDPVLPEERMVFELVGLERSEPDQYRKNGGIKWTWRVFQEDGRTPFVFNDEQYLFFRTTGVDSKGKPTMNLGTNAYEWASAMLGRDLGMDETLSVIALRGARMSAMVVWEKQKTDPTKKTIKLASLRHVPASASKPATQVSSDPSLEDVDRALLITKLEKKVARAVKKKTENALTFQTALDNIDTASISEIEGILENVDAELDALDD